MRRTKTRAPLPADAADTVRRLAAEGATQLQIAAALGMSKDRFWRYLKDPAFEDLRVAWEQGKAQDEKLLADALLDIALGHRKGNAAACMFLLKTKHQWREYLPISDGESQGPQITISLQASLPADQYLKVVEAKALPVQRKELTDGYSPQPLPEERAGHPRGV